MRIILADDHKMIRAGIREYLGRYPVITEIIEVDNGLAAWNKIKAEWGAQRPFDIALLDIRMPNMDGLTIASKIKEHNLSTKVIMLTALDAPQYVTSALRVGAKGFVLKTATPAALFSAIQTVKNNSVYIDPDIAPILTQPELQIEELTKREIEVLEMVMLGYTDNEIAHTLNVSDRTIQTHVGNCYRKLCAKNRTEASLLALKYGIIDADVILQKQTRSQKAAAEIYS